MRIAYRLVLLGSVVSLAPGTAFSQDDVDLIDDLPKETKQAAAKKAQPQGPQASGDQGKRPRSGATPQKSAPGGEAKTPVPNTDLIDDLSPEQKQTGRANAATKKAASLIPDKLADALAQALHNSPGILVAEAKVREAQAELNEVRQNVVHDLTVTFRRWSYNKDLAKMPENLSDLSAERVRDAALAVREDEAKLHYLLGVGTDARAATDSNDSGHSAGRGGMHQWEWHRGGMAPGGMGPAGMGPMMGPMGMGPGGMGPGGMGAGGMSPMGEATNAMTEPGSGKRVPTDRLEQFGEDLKQLSNLPEMARFLEKRVEMDFTAQPLKEVLDYLEEVGKAEVDFVILNPEEWELPRATENTEGLMDRSVTLRLKQVTIAAALQALADLYNCAFVFRDYGILVLGPDHVQGMGMLDSYRAAGTPMIAPPPPPGVMGAMRMGTGVGMGGMMPGMQAKPSEQTPAEE